MGRFSTYRLGGIALLIFASSLFAQDDLKTTLFKEVNEVRAAAKEVQADLLSPENFRKGVDEYLKAEADFSRGKNLDDVRKRLDKATMFFSKAHQGTELANVTFRTLMKARSDAENAEAIKYARLRWQDGESAFFTAARALEKGDITTARNKGADAEKLYRQAELESIKLVYLEDTWKLIREARELKVEKRAPQTLARAETLVRRAEKELNENRYDLDLPRSLAREANYEARHALYLANTITKLEQAKQSYEDLMLAWERPIRAIAEKMDFVAEFDEGLGKPTLEIERKFIEAQEKAENLSSEIAERDDRIANYEQRLAEIQTHVAKLEKQVGHVEQERSALAQRMAEQAENRKRFTQVAEFFTRDEARVYREGERVYLRLHSLNFPVGRSTIEPQYYALLAKVRDAINIFPDCSIEVNGHTDSHGSDEANLRLSEERAAAVKQYMTVNMQISPSRIASIGFGESQPIASNETKAGRAKNRRIDVVIEPKIMADESGTN